MYCKQIFNSPSVLKIHVRTHTGEKPFRCNLCQYRSAQKGNVKTHLARKHGTVVDVSQVQWMPAHGSLKTEHSATNNAASDGGEWPLFQEGVNE